MNMKLARNNDMRIMMLLVKYLSHRLNIDDSVDSLVLLSIVN